MPFITCYGDSRNVNSNTLLLTHKPLYIYILFILTDQLFLSRLQEEFLTVKGFQLGCSSAEDFFFLPHSLFPLCQELLYKLFLFSALFQIPVASLDVAWTCHLFSHLHLAKFLSDYFSLLCHSYFCHTNPFLCCPKDTKGTVLCTFGAGCFQPGLSLLSKLCLDNTVVLWHLADSAPMALLFVHKQNLLSKMQQLLFLFLQIAYTCSFWSAEQITATWRSQNINCFCHCYHSCCDRSSGGLDKGCGHINRERQCFGHKPGGECTVPALIKQTDYVLLKAQKARKASLEMALKKMRKAAPVCPGINLSVLGVGTT